MLHVILMSHSTKCRNDECHYVELGYDACHSDQLVKLHIILSVILLNVILMNVIMQRQDMLLVILISK
jgi:hypothetical protein